MRGRFAAGKERFEPEGGSPVLAARAADALQWLAGLPYARRNRTGVQADARL